MNKHVAIIVGGTGQFGRILTKKLLKKNYFIIITTRSVNKSIKFLCYRVGLNSLLKSIVIFIYGAVM